MKVRVGALDLEVEIDGPAEGEPLLMIMGLGLQLTSWPEGLVQQLVQRGYRVIRYDHRDIGLSSPQDHLGPPQLTRAFWRQCFGLPLHAPYRLADLADDAAGLLAALQIPAAQVVGISMGGMVAQHLAARHPQRIKGLNLWMSSPGGRWLPPPKAQILRLLLKRPGREQMDAHFVQLYRAIGSPAHPVPEDELQARVAANLARAYRPQATARQMIAMAADGDRRRWLGSLQRPIQVLHGTADPLLPVAHGRALARALPQAQYTELPTLGHDLPQALWPQFVAAVERAHKSSTGRPEMT
ncbi:pimeloyl-ACP methyl ester carboxylesterase [Inhella inkyongensis]|uniref:Pimeloyl-ACP methyl ester carboxylesterase n=1 Tax=Inhella inkyongensis TaxID=392593 RepID=A0A840S6F4_9BURK|nr:alpha/beta hydrolase [Inhella inkyongensis]MBB5205273.1 pimeloyl-ACP methyl ester carboxylesterase [Inhella inkyongensis]